MKDFEGKIAFITGGACGAGLGYAQLFSEAGMKVVIADNRQDHIDEAMAYFSSFKGMDPRIPMAPLGPMPLTWVSILKNSDTTMSFCQVGRIFSKGSGSNLKEETISR